jgi:hypothetical protein
MTPTLPNPEESSFSLSIPLCHPERDGHLGCGVRAVLRCRVCAPPCWLAAGLDLGPLQTRFRPAPGSLPTGVSQSQPGSLHLLPGSLSLCLGCPLITSTAGHCQVLTA